MASPLVSHNQALLRAPPMMPVSDVIQLLTKSGMHDKKALAALKGRMLTGAGPEHVPSDSLPSHAPQPSCHAQVPLQVVVASNSDKAFKNAMLQTVKAIEASSMHMALTFRHDGCEYTEASSRAQGLITEMIAEDCMDPIPVWRFRGGDDGAWLA